MIDWHSMFMEHNSWCVQVQAHYYYRYGHKYFSSSPLLQLLTHNYVNFVQMYHATITHAKNIQPRTWDSLPHGQKHCLFLNHVLTVTPLWVSHHIKPHLHWVICNTPPDKWEAILRYEMTLSDDVNDTWSR